MEQVKILAKLITLQEIINSLIEKRLELEEELKALQKEENG